MFIPIMPMAAALTATTAINATRVATTPRVLPQRQQQAEGRSISNLVAPRVRKTRLPGVTITTLA